MKKILYVLLLVFVIGTSLTSCTEENVSPKTNETPPSGTGNDPKG